MLLVQPAQKLVALLLLLLLLLLIQTATDLAIYSHCAGCVWYLHS